MVNVIIKFWKIHWDCMRYKLAIVMIYPTWHTKPPKLWNLNRFHTHSPCLPRRRRRRCPPAAGPRPPRRPRRGPPGVPRSLWLVGLRQPHPDKHDEVSLSSFNHSEWFDVKTPSKSIALMRTARLQNVDAVKTGKWSTLQMVFTLEIMVFH